MLFRAAFFLMCALVSAEAPSSKLGKSLPNTEDVLQEIKAVNSENDPESRKEKAEKMSGDIFVVWKAGKIDSLDTKIISELVPLLDDTNDAIRGWAACAIGYFGPRAKNAAHSLRAAEERETEEVIAAAKAQGEKAVMAPAYDSTACIEQALTHIGNAPQ